LSDTEIVAVAPPETERDLLMRLDKLVESGQLRLTIDRSKLSSLDFPLYSEADGNIWVYSMIAVAALVWWQLGNWAGIAAVAVALVLYQTLGKAYVARRLDQRIRSRGLKETEIWRALWRFGGVILTPADGGEPVQGPQGSWHALARGGGGQRPVA
jgi:hypothetical protein